ncbi:hypothetical protein GCM10022243_11470 [Saccharothrix violaceirubra]
MPPVVKPDFYETADFHAAFDSQHVGRVIKVYRHHPRHLQLFGGALSQELMARWLRMTQGAVSKLENAKTPELDIDRLRFYAKTLHFPQKQLWFRIEEHGHLENVSLGSTLDNFSVPPTLVFEDADPLTGSVLTDSLFLGAGSLPQRVLPAIIRETTADLQMMDFKRGGGHARRLVMHYFQNEVAPLLSWHYADVSLRQEIFSAAAELLRLIGWTAYDAGRHGTAAQYFTQALRIAHEARDSSMVGVILANMSHQANYMGRFDDAVKLAQQALDVTRDNPSKTLQAMIHAMEARARASLGDKLGMVASLNTVEKVFNTRDIDHDPAWISYFDQHELAGEAAHCFLAIGEPGQVSRFSTLAIDPDRTPPRTRSFIRMVAASGALADGDLESAIALATEAIETNVSLQSARYVKYLTDFQAALKTRHPGKGSQVFDLLRAHYPRLSLES